MTLELRAISCRHIKNTKAKMLNQSPGRCVSRKRNPLAFAALLMFALVSGLVGKALAANMDRKITPWSIVLLLDPAATTISPAALLRASGNSKDSADLQLLARFGSPISIERLFPEPHSRSLAERIEPNFGGADGKLATLEQYVAAFHPEDLLQRYVKLNFDSSASRDGALKSIQRNEAFLVLYAEIERWGSDYAAVTPVDNYFPQPNTGAGVPPGSTFQWGLHATRFPDAWEKARGYGYVAVLDAGLRDENRTSPGTSLAPPAVHPDLRRSVRERWSASVGGTEPDPVFAWADPGFSTEQHGTHVAGILGATPTDGTINNGASNSGIVGACWDCSIAIYRRNPPGSIPANWPVGVPYVSSIQSLAEGVRRAVRHGMQAVSFSASKSNSSEITANYCLDVPASPACVVFSLAQTYGVALIAANGNEKNANDFSGIGWPARDSRWIAVAGTRYSSSTPRIWDNGYTSTTSGSNWGPQTAVAAPAKDIVSTITLGPAGSPFLNYGASDKCGDDYGPDLATSQGYGTCSGTSMATPLVSGAVMLIRSANPLLTPVHVKSILGETADPCRTDAGALDPNCGPGQLNALNAVTKALDYERTPPRGTVVNRTTPLMGAYTPSGVNHFYTTIPQMMRAAFNGTLMPRALPVFGGSTSKLWPKKTPAEGADCSPTGFPSKCYDFTGVYARSVVTNAVVANVRVRVTRTFFDALGQETGKDVSLDKTVDSGELASYLVDFRLPLPAAMSVLTEVVNMFGNQEEPMAYAAVGNPIPGGTSWFPSCGSLPPSESCVNEAPLAIASLYTTRANPMGGDPLLPLYRMSVRCADTADAATGGNSNAICTTNPRHVSHIYTASTAFQTAMQSKGYALDGIEGYLYSPAISQPAGTVKLCRKFDASRDDWILFPGYGSNGTDCSTASSVYTNAGNYSSCKGETSLQSVNCNFSTSNDNWIGWVPSLNYPTAVLPVSAGTRAISGQIMYGDAPVQGVTLAGAGATCTLTDSEGFYTCVVATTFSGTIEPSANGYAFSPPYRTYSNVVSNVTGEDYEAHDANLVMFGAIIRQNGQGLGGVSLTGSGTSCTQTDYSGVYTCNVSWGWAGSLTPSPYPTWWFYPGYRSLGPITQSGWYDGFTPIRPRIQGTVTRTNNTGVQNVKIDGAQRSDTGYYCYTDVNGDYDCTVAVGYTGSLTPQKAGCSFSPSSRSYVNYQSNMAYQNYSTSVSCP